MAFIKLDRKYFDNFLWNEARVYSKAEAWLDLIQSARIEANKEFINGKMIEVQRGEIPASRRFLELRWQWGSSKVSNFLKLLVSQGMITTKQTNGQTVISLCKYKDYNDKQTTKQTTDEPPTNQQQTTDEPPTNQIEEYKNIRIEESTIPPNPQKGKGSKKSFLSEIPNDWVGIVSEWLDYKKSKKQSYRSAKSVKVFYDRLEILSGGDLSTARQIIQRSIGNNWAGIFKLKNDKPKKTERKYRNDDVEIYTSEL